MAIAEILIGPRAIRTEELLDKRYNLNGFLVEFTVPSKNGNIVYIHVPYNNFKESDIRNDNPNNVKSGYYHKAVFLEYKARKKSLKQVQDVELSLNEKIENAVKNDLLKVKSLYVTTPYDVFYQLAEFSFAYDGNPKSLLDDRFNIRIPDGTIPTHITNSNATFPAKEFYRKRKVILESFSLADKPRAALELSKIALLIDMINKDVFPAFYLGDTSYTSFVASQNDYWQDADLFINPTLAQLDLFLNQLIGYYTASSPNFQAIANAVGMQKLYWIASLMPPMSLGAFPIEDKLILLQFIAKNELSKFVEKISQEELVINICSSFNEVNLSQIDVFLEALVSKKWRINVSSSETLFETLYASMSTSTNFKEGLLILSNWVMGTNYKPTQTKGQFVQTIYALWSLSKYNPYNTNGSIKPNTIAFPEKNNDLVSFVNTTDTSNYLFKYTHYTASDPYYWSNKPDIKGYKETRPDASPIVMPYNSYSILGIFFDNFSFKFNGAKILAYQDLQYVSKYWIDEDELERKVFSSMETYYGNYDIFQPVGLLSTNLETKTGISTVKGETIEENGQEINGLIPIFALKFIDDAGDRSDVETMIGYTLDVLTTATGFGNLARLRYLKWASTGLDGVFSISGLRTVIAGVEFSSGALGLLGGFITCNENDEFCSGIKSFLKIFQVASLSLTAVNGLISTTIYLQSAAAKLRQIAGGIGEAEIIANIKNRIRDLNPGANETDIDDLGRIIYKSSFLPSFSNSQVARIEKAVDDFFKQNPKLVRNPAYTKEIVREHILLCIQQNVDDRGARDWVCFSNRKIVRKYVDPNELERRVNFHTRYVRVRRFPGGFANYERYVDLCIAFKTTFESNLSKIGIDINELGDIKYVVKGSAAYAPHSSDLQGSIPNQYWPLKKADDLDLGVVLTEKGFKRLVEILRKNADDIPLTTTTRDFRRNLKKGEDLTYLMYSFIFDQIKIDNSTFSKVIANECFGYSHFPVEKIGFSIILKDGKYDNFPDFPFYFNY